MTIDVSDGWSTIATVTSNVISSLVWPLALVTLLIVFRAQLGMLVSALVSRVRAGSSVRLFQIEIGALPAIKPGETNASSFSRAFTEDDPAIWNRRKHEYDRTRGVEIVHKLAPSDAEGQLYDVLIFAIPHRAATLLSVTRVDYYLASAWGDRVYFSDDRARAFAIRVSAYGPFLCLAHVFFNDGVSIDAFRYVDFEMGDVVPALDATADSAKGNSARGRRW